jgi:hypothetical protein
MTSTGESVRPISTWAPLRSPVYRALWIAQLVSNLGTWMQTVGAQWMLVGDPRAAGLCRGRQRLSYHNVTRRSVSA